MAEVWRSGYGVYSLHSGSSMCYNMPRTRNCDEADKGILSLGLLELLLREISSLFFSFVNALIFRFSESSL